MVINLVMTESICYSKRTCYRICTYEEQPSGSVQQLLQHIYCIQVAAEKQRPLTCDAVGFSERLLLEAHWRVCTSIVRDIDSKGRRTFQLLRQAYFFFYEQLLKLVIKLG